MFPHPEVRQIFIKFNDPLEGRCNFIYCDVKGLVTTGVGNLIDPISAALSLPWLKADMSPASQADIRAAWNTVKNKTEWVLRGGGIYKSLTELRLTEADIDKLVYRRFDQMCAFIRAAHPRCVEWPADAQLAVLSMAWAMGPAFRFPKFWAAMDRLDYLGAAAECNIIGKGTIVQRNLANKLLLVNADRVRQGGLDGQYLNWPKILPPPGGKLPLGNP